MPIFKTYPNQRIVHINRVKPEKDYLGIKNENWQAAARDLSPHAMMLYFYLASNKDGYNFALSHAAIREAIGMARSTYHDQFHILVDKRYLVHKKGNQYEFYEVPQPRDDTQGQSSMSNDGFLNVSLSSDGQSKPHAVNNCSPCNIEIYNNNHCTPNSLIDNENQNSTKSIQKVEYTGFKF